MAMKADVQQSMNDYYNERAPEYDEIYMGKGPASISNPDAYKTETTILAQLVEQYCVGNHLDMPCGTGFWLPHYAQKCQHMTLVDQSENMLAECRKKASEARVLNKCQFICTDIWHDDFLHDQFDSILFGFFISHLPPEEEAKLFSMLRILLTNGGTFLILDSIWSAERAAHRNKEGVQERILNDGRRFDIYKKYFTAEDFGKMGQMYQCNITVLHTGQTFIAALGQY